MIAATAGYRSGRGGSPGKIVVLVLLAAAVPSGVRGGFRIQETESFDGNQVDTATWQPLSYGASPTPVRQQDCLIFDDMGECITAQTTVEVGDIVRVQLLEHPLGASRSCLYLTTKSQENRIVVDFDSHFVYVGYSYSNADADYGFEACTGGGGHAGGRVFGLATPPPVPGRPLTLQIQRVTENTCVSRAYDSNMVGLGEPQTTTFFDLRHDEKFYICLAAWPAPGGRTVFDNVTILRAPTKTPAPPSTGTDTLSLGQGDFRHPFGEVASAATPPGLAGPACEQTFCLDQAGWFRLDRLSFAGDDTAPLAAPVTCPAVVLPGRTRRSST